MQVLVSLFGILSIVALAVLMSTDRSAINRRTVLIAFAIQATIAALILFVPAGSVVLDTIVQGVQRVINYGNDGIEFVFGSNIKDSLGFTIAFNVLPVIVFFAALYVCSLLLGNHATRCRIFRRCAAPTFADESR